MKLWIPVLVLFLSVGCSKLDSMADTTKKMGDTTDEMKTSTQNLEKKSDHLAIVTDELYTGMRESESIKNQTEAFDRLKSSSDLMDKAHYALIYFAAFEFQSWQGVLPDTEESRQRMYTKAIDLFFSHISGLVDDSFPLEQNKFDIFTGDNNWNVLSTLAMTMAKIHPDQAARAIEHDFEPMTFYGLIQSGLRAKALYENPATRPQVKEYQVTVLKNERVARYLMQLRHNYFKALVIAQMSDIEDGIFGGLLNKLGKLISMWVVDLSVFPHAEMSEINEWLWKAWETQDFLREIGMPVKHNADFDAILANASFIVPDARWSAYQNRISTLSDKAWTLQQVLAEDPDTFFFSLLKRVSNPDVKVPFKVYRGPLSRNSSW